MLTPTENIVKKKFETVTLENVLWLLHMFSQQNYKSNCLQDVKCYSIENWLS